MLSHFLNLSLAPRTSPGKLCAQVGISGGGHCTTDLSHLRPGLTAAELTCM
jgi:hypothetical protein